MHHVSTITSEIVKILKLDFHTGPQDQVKIVEEFDENIWLAVNFLDFYYLRNSSIASLSKEHKTSLEKQNSSIQLKGNFLRFFFTIYFNSMYNSCACAHSLM